MVLDLSDRHVLPDEWLKKGVVNFFLGKWALQTCTHIYMVYNAQYISPGNGDYSLIRNMTIL